MLVMLQKLNERIQGVIAWLVIGVIAFTFTLFGLEYYIQSHQSSDVKVTIDDITITNQDFENNYRRARSQQDPVKITAATDKRLKNEVIETMISNEVAVTAGRKAGFEISMEQANNAIVGIPQFQEDGQFSTERYQQVLNSALFTPESFQAEVRQGMLLNQQRFAFMGTAFVLSYEIERFVKLYMQTRDYDYLIIPASLFKKNIHVTSEEIKRFYEKHQSEFQSPEKVRIEYVQLSMPDVRSNIKITEEDVKNYYDENRNNFLMPAQWKVAHILFSIPENASESTQEDTLKKAEMTYKLLQDNPQQFDNYVKDLSDDKVSIASKGLLPWITAGQQPELDNTLITLNKIGQISLPVRTKYGYEIFKLDAHKPATVKPFEQVQNIIKNQLQIERAQTKYAQLLEQLSDLSYQTPDSLQPVSEALNMPVKKTDFFSSNNGNDELTKNKAVISAAFSHDVLDLGNNSEPIQLNNESVIVLRVNKHINAVATPLAEVASIISSQINHTRASIEAEALGNRLLKSQSEIDKFLKDNQLYWQTAKAITRDGATEIVPDINSLAYKLSKPGMSNGQRLGNGDYVLVKLKQINQGKIKDLDKEQSSSLSQQIEASYGVMDYDLYLDNLIKHAKIERH